MGEDAVRLAKNRNVLAALLEAVLGALFLEHGFAAIEEAVVAAFEDRIEYALTTYVDHKTELQEVLARLGRQVSYEVVDVDRPGARAPLHVRRRHRRGADGDGRRALEEGGRAGRREGGARPARGLAPSGISEHYRCAAGRRPEPWERGRLHPGAIDPRVGDARPERARRPPRRARPAGHPPRRRRAEEQGSAVGDRQLIGAAHERERQVRPHRRDAGAQAGDHPLHRGVLRPRRRARERHRLLGREAGDLQHAAHARRPAGRGRHPRAVLGELPGDDTDGLRPSGDRHAGGRRLRADACGGRGGLQLVYEGARRQQPEQPVRRGVSRRADRGARRSSARSAAST